MEVYYECFPLDWPQHLLNGEPLLPIISLQYSWEDGGGGGCARKMATQRVHKGRTYPRGILMRW